jgi:acetolactate synthase small subunit
MLTFVVHARRTPEILARVVLLFHGRRVQIDSFTARPGEESDVLRIEVTVVEDRGKAAFIEANLYRLFDVLLVEKKDVVEEMPRQGYKDGHREP